MGPHRSAESARNPTDEWHTRGAGPSPLHLAKALGSPERTGFFRHGAAYLEERPDFDGSRVAYLGLSLGAGIAPSLLPYETRFRAAILYSGGFGKRESQESIDQRTARARRIEIPLLMLGGRHDFGEVGSVVGLTRFVTRLSLRR